MVEPLYPLEARASKVEGEVHIIIAVGVDGRVVWATGSRQNPLTIEATSKNAKVSHLLIEEAEENAEQWLWGPFPQNFQFPWYHEILYVFRLQGKPFPGVHVVRTNLPDQVEIISSPLLSGPDFSNWKPVELKPKNKSPRGNESTH